MGRVDFRPSGSYHRDSVARGSSPQRPVRWQDVLHATPEQPRKLTLHELQRLNRLGFTSLTRALAGGVCPGCGLNKTGTGHRQLCVEPEQQRNPAPAPEPVRQPWEPRPSRRAA